MKEDIKIVCAAIKIFDIIYCGARHHDEIMNKQIYAVMNIEEMYRYKKEGKYEQGFIDNLGNFHSRESALEIAKKSGQILNINNIRHNKLFSEDLY